MVIGLQLPFRSLPLKGMPGKAQSVDSAFHDLTLFGEILKRKEQQLQQEQVNASSIAAALAAMRSQPMVFPSSIPTIETSKAQGNSPADGSPQAAADAKNAIVHPPSALGRRTPTETSGAVTPAFTSTLADSSLQPGLPSMQFSLSSATELIPMNFATVAATSVGSTEREGSINKSGLHSFSSDENISSLPAAAPEIETSTVETKLTPVQSPAKDFAPLQSTSASNADEKISNHSSTPPQGALEKDGKQTPFSGLRLAEVRNAPAHPTTPAESGSVKLSHDQPVDAEMEQSQPDARIKIEHAQKPLPSAQQMVGKNAAPEITVPSPMTPDSSASLSTSETTSAPAQLKMVLESARYETPATVENPTVTRPISTTQSPSSEGTTSKLSSTTSQSISFETLAPLPKPTISAVPVAAVKQNAEDIRGGEVSKITTSETAVSHSSELPGRKIMTASSERSETELLQPAFAPASMPKKEQQVDAEKPVNVPQPGSDLESNPAANLSAREVVVRSDTSLPNAPTIRDAIREMTTPVASEPHAPVVAPIKPLTDHGTTKVEAKPVSIQGSELNLPEAKNQLAYSQVVTDAELEQGANSFAEIPENRSETQTISASFTYSGGKPGKVVNVSKSAMPVEQGAPQVEETITLQPAKPDETDRPASHDKSISTEDSTSNTVRNVHASESSEELSPSETVRTTKIKQPATNVQSADQMVTTKHTEVEPGFTEPKIASKDRPVESKTISQSADAEMIDLEPVAEAQTILASDRPIPVTDDTQTAKAFRPAAKPETQNPTFISNESAQVFEADPQVVVNRQQTQVSDEFIPDSESEFQERPAASENLIGIGNLNSRTSSGKGTGDPQPFESLTLTAGPAGMEEAANQTGPELGPDLQKINNTASTRFTDSEWAPAKATMSMHAAPKQDIASVQTVPDSDVSLVQPAANPAHMTQPKLQETAETIEQPAYRDEQNIDESVHTFNAKTAEQSFVFQSPTSHDKIPIADIPTIVTERVLEGKVHSQDRSTDVNHAQPETIKPQEKPVSPQMKSAENSQPVVNDAVVSPETTFQAEAQPSVTTKPEIPEQFSHAMKPVNSEAPFGVDMPASPKNIEDRKILEQNKTMDFHQVSTPSVFEPAIDIAAGSPLEAKEGIDSQLPSTNKEDTRALDKQPEADPSPEITVTANGPVKTAPEAAVSQKTLEPQICAQAVDVARQVIHQMKMHVKRGTTSMHLQLNPGELGAIEVDMVSSSEGLQVTIFAEQAHTGRLLETQLNQLRDSLVESGVQLSGLNIGQHHTQGQKGGTFSQAPNLSSFAPMDFAEGNVEEAPTRGQTFGPSSEVDYRI